MRQSKGPNSGSRPLRFAGLRVHGRVWIGLRGNEAEADGEATGPDCGVSEPGRDPYSSSGGTYSKD